jgi:uncharacterized RmlC-like cupin family protein
LKSLRPIEIARFVPQAAILVAYLQVSKVHKEFAKKERSMRRLLLILATGGLLLTSAAADQTIIGERNGQDIVTVRVTEATQSKQGLPIFTGISANTAGAKGLSLVKVVIPPGGSAEAHVHKGYESAVYLLQGHVETRYGAGLKKSVVNVAGDFVFIPPDVPHQPFNLSDTEPAIAIVARNDPNEQEHVVLYPKGQ